MACQPGASVPLAPGQRVRLRRPVGATLVMQPITALAGELGTVQVASDQSISVRLDSGALTGILGEGPWIVSFFEPAEAAAASPLPFGQRVRLRRSTIATLGTESVTALEGELGFVQSSSEDSVSVLFDSGAETGIIGAPPWVASFFEPVDDVPTSLSPVPDVLPVGQRVRIRQDLGATRGTETVVARKGLIGTVYVASSNSVSVELDCGAGRTGLMGDAAYVSTYLEPVGATECQTAAPLPVGQRVRLRQEAMAAHPGGEALVASVGQLGIVLEVSESSVSVRLDSGAETGVLGDVAWIASFFEPVPTASAAAPLSVGDRVRLRRDVGATRGTEPVTAVAGTLGVVEASSTCGVGLRFDDGAETGILGEAVWIGSFLEHCAAAPPPTRIATQRPDPKVNLPSKPLRCHGRTMIPQAS